MDRMKLMEIPSSSKRKKIVAQVVIGLALIILSGKLAFDLYSSTQVEFDLNDKPALLFITDDKPCDCAKKTTAEADYQIKNWSAPNLLAVQLIQIYIGDHRELEAKYDVFRSPALILLDAQGKVVYRQDYPIIGGKPFDLQEFEIKMRELTFKQ